MFSSDLGSIPPTSWRKTQMCCASLAPAVILLRHSVSPQKYGQLCQYKQLEILSNYMLYAMRCTPESFA
jgi:hypothetical protein